MKQGKLKICSTLLQLKDLTRKHKRIHIYKFHKRTEKIFSERDSRRQKRLFWPNKRFKHPFQIYRSNVLPFNAKFQNVSRFVMD